ncbi:hypothetical protein SEA_OBITOO_39 [Arthrobacter phage ObiToo]|nr:hypothetical protein SEA_OBITOO_39 [Arthrobacter phage ObiToo]
MIREIQDAINAALEKRREHEEAACRAMLRDPLQRGVLVIERGTAYTIDLSPEVPWLEIHVRREEAPIECQ